MATWRRFLPFLNSITTIILLLCVVFSVHLIKNNFIFFKQTKHTRSNDRQNPALNPNVSVSCIDKPEQAINSSSPSSSSSSSSLPALFIYRRSRKTGSSSMLTSLLKILIPLGYHPLYLHPGIEMHDVVRNEFSKPNPRRLLIIEHNTLTKQIHPFRNVVIADTIRDGFDQITSTCRYVARVDSCTSKEMAECMCSKALLDTMKFRWAGREKEDDDTYIDLPLSVKHPALSTSVLRSAFHDVHIDVNFTVHDLKYHVRNSHCDRKSNLLKVYKEYYKQLEEDNEMLKKRMLILTGYFVHNLHNNTGTSIDQMLEEAEIKELKKYDIETDPKASHGISKEHREVVERLKHWTLDSHGKLVLVQRRRP